MFVKQSWPDRLQSLALIGIAVLPLSLLLFPDVGEAIYTLVTLAGLIMLLREGLAPEERDKLFLVSLLTLLFFAVAALSIVASGDYAGWFKPLKKLSKLLATPFVALVLLRANIAPRNFILIAKVSVLVLFLVALYQFVVLHNIRPGGATSPLQFAHVSLLLGYCSLIALPTETARQRILSLGAFGAGFMATLLSQSRIEWINAFILLPVLILVWKRSGLLTKEVAWIVSCALLSLLLFALSMPFVHERVDTALGEYEMFHDQAAWNNSIGQRLLMWESGLKAAIKKPVLGWGIHRSQQAAVAELSDPLERSTLIEHHNLHNEYVNTLVAKGIVGLLSLFALLFIPLTIYFANAADKNLVVYTGSGILLCVAYAVSGLTYQAFGDATMNSLFVIVLSYTLTAVDNRPFAVRWPFGRVSSAATDIS